MGRFDRHLARTGSLDRLELPEIVGKFVLGEGLEKLSSGRSIQVHDSLDKLSLRYHSQLSRMSAMNRLARGTWVAVNDRNKLSATMNGKL